jgi:hypothetical protein
MPEHAIHRPEYATIRLKKMAPPVTTRISVLWAMSALTDHVLRELNRWTAMTATSVPTTAAIQIQAASTPITPQTVTMA